MNFPIVLSHASMHHWKDSSGMPISSVVTTFLMSEHAFKTGPLDNPYKLEEKKKSHGVRSGEYWGCSSTTMFPSVRNRWCLLHPVLLLLPKSSVVTFQAQSFYMSSWLATIWRVKRQSPYTTYLTCSTLTSVLLVEDLSLLKSSFTGSRLALKCYATQKIRVCDLVSFPYTCWSISSAYDGIFPNQAKKFRVYSLLSIHCSLLSAHSWMIWIRNGVNKSVWKKCDGSRKLRLQLYTPTISC